jgi:L-glyceraldehyde 3-phosphate reductase
MALAWVLQRPEVTSVIVGTSSVEQLLDNLRAVQSAPFTPDELSAIASALA